MARGAGELLKPLCARPARLYVGGKLVHPFELPDALFKLDAGEDRAERAHGGEVRRYYVVRFVELKDLLEGLPYALVGGNPALKGHGGDKVLALADGRLEVTRNRVAEPGDDVVVGGGYLLEVYHVALGEDGATAGHSRRVLALQCQMAELLYGEPHAVGLLVEERPCAGGAYGVHLEVGNPELAAFLLRHEDELGVLPAHLDERPGLRVVDLGSLCLRYDLVGKAGAYHRGYELSAASGDGHELYVLPAVLLHQLRQHGEGRLKRLALGPCIMLFEQVLAFIENYRIGAYRAYINAYINHSMS